MRGRWPLGALPLSLCLILTTMSASAQDQEQSDLCANVTQAAVSLPTAVPTGVYTYVVCPDASRAVMFTTFIEDPAHPQDYMKVWDSDGSETYWFGWWSNAGGGVRIVQQVPSSGTHYLPDVFPYDNLTAVPPSVSVLYMFHTAMDIASPN